MDWYNGFSPAERNANGRALNKAIKAGTVSHPTGPCALCGDLEAPLEYHSENYSKPFDWSPPAAYAVCRHCHRNKLHKRFTNPDQWQAFKAHVRRGGYASDLVANPKVKREVEAYRLALPEGSPVKLHPLRPYQGVVGKEWWAQLAAEPVSLKVE